MPVKPKPHHHETWNDPSGPPAADGATRTNAAEDATPPATKSFAEPAEDLQFALRTALTLALDQLENFVERSDA